MLTGLVLLCDAHALCASIPPKGLGYNTWENVWGSWNGISPRDGETMRRIFSILRAAAAANATSSCEYRPFYPGVKVLNTRKAASTTNSDDASTAVDLAATLFPGKEMVLLTAINQRVGPIGSYTVALNMTTHFTTTAAHRADARADGIAAATASSLDNDEWLYFDLWRGVQLSPTYIEAPSTAAAAAASSTAPLTAPSSSSAAAPAGAQTATAKRHKYVNMNTFINTESDGLTFSIPLLRQNSMPAARAGGTNLDAATPPLLVAQQQQQMLQKVDDHGQHQSASRRTERENIAGTSEGQQQQQQQRSRVLTFSGHDDLQDTNASLI